MDDDELRVARMFIAGFYQANGMRRGKWD